MLLARGLTLDLAVERLVDLLPLLVLTLVSTALLEIAVYLFFKKVLRSQFTLPYTLVAPAAMALLLFTVYPFFFNIRLAFSDLRLKTMSCYIPDNAVTDAPCSLSQAAPRADVQLQVSEYPVREEQNEEVAAVAFTLSEGDEIYITGKSSKINNYIRFEGSARRPSDDGLTLTGEVCSPVDRACIDAFREFQTNVLDMQDERDWWPVRAGDGEEGWIPDYVHYATETAPLFDEITGGTEIGQVDEGQEVRLAAAESLPTQWREVQLPDGQTGWVPATNARNQPTIDRSRTFAPEAEAPLYAEPSATSEVVATLAASEAVRLLQDSTFAWYQVFVTAPQFVLPDDADPAEASDQIGWVNIQARSTTTITVFKAGTEADLYATVDDLIVGLDLERPTDYEEPANVDPPVGSVEAGESLVMETRDELTLEATTLYRVRTADGTVGWTVTTPLDLNENLEVLLLADETPLYEDTDTASTVLGRVTGGEQVNFIEHNDDLDQTWYRVQTADRTVGWTTVNGTIDVDYAAAEALEVFPQMGGVGEPLGAIEEGDAITVLSDTDTPFVRYHVRLLDGTVGWIDTAPEKVITTERDVVLYSLEYGWDNFKRVFVKEDPDTGDVEGWGRLLQTQNSTFPRLMRTTLAWTSLNVLFHLIGGMSLALVLNRSGLRFRGLYRAVIILPWAIPQPIIALAWKGEFHYNFGFVNTMLVELGLDRINWLYSPGPAFAAVTFVNIWLGIPFYMVTLLGGLQSIAGEYYEAAEIDGANAWQRFRNVTVPLIRPVAVPIVTLDVIWTFNNFNVIYLITKGEPNESTNILVTALYNAAFGENGQFQLGFAAAFSLVIFAVLFIFASIWVTSSGALKGVYEEA